jgi:hypothetical protein
VAVDPTGATVCDRCGFVLAGDGVTTGLVCSDITDDGSNVDRIYCYQRGCAATATAGLVNYPNLTNPPACTTCQVPLEAWTAAFALIGTDLDGDTPRQLAFCRVNSHREQFLNQGYS